MKLSLFILTAFLLSFLTPIPSLHADDQIEAAEAMPGYENNIDTAIVFHELSSQSPLDSIPRKTYPEPEFKSEVSAFIFFVGLVSLITGMFSPLVTLILGGVCIVVGVIMLLLYNKLKKSNPFKSINIVGKILGWLFFILLMAIMIAAIIMAFVMALALIVAAIAGSVANPIYVAFAILGLGALVFLINLIVYLFKKRRYTKSLS